jgi:hypothetical protein
MIYTVLMLTRRYPHEFTSMYTTCAGPGTRYNFATELQLRVILGMNTYYTTTECDVTESRCRCSDIPNELNLIQICPVKPHASFASAEAVTNRNNAHNIAPPVAKEQRGCRDQGKSKRRSSSAWDRTRNLPVA